MNKHASYYAPRFDRHELGAVVRTARANGFKYEVEITGSELRVVCPNNPHPLIITFDAHNDVRLKKLCDAAEEHGAKSADFYTEPHSNGRDGVVALILTH